MTKKTKKQSAMRKLVPAAGMLAVSAMMLASSTYAWFTMAREVEVQNIQMTATVPEDLQVSAGNITEGKNLNDTGSYLVRNGEDEPTKAIMWSNSLIVSQYYTLGKIIPASSTTGLNVFFTPDATAVGKTVAADAEYISAASALTAQSDKNSRTYMTTLHVNKADETSPWTGTRAAAYDKTNDDGYYVDVPIWLRTSSDANVSLSVEAYVKAYEVDNKDVKAVDEATIELYKAARVVIIDPTGDTTNDTGSKTAKTSNLIPLKDGSWNAGALDWNYYGRTATGATGENIENAAVFASGTYGGSTSIYGAAEYYNGKSAVCTVAGSGDSEYGTAKKVYARVWLEGEDQECWNQNAGQNFSINLNFKKIESSTTSEDQNPEQTS